MIYFRKKLIVLFAILFFIFSLNTTFISTLAVSKQKTTAKAKQKTSKAPAKKNIKSTKTPVKTQSKTSSKTAAKPGTKTSLKTVAKPGTKTTVQTTQKTEVKNTASSENKNNDKSNQPASQPEETKKPEPEKVITVSNMEELYKFIEESPKDKVEFKDSKIQQCYEKAQGIINQIITSGMTDFEKEKAIHDYVILISDIQKPSETSTSAVDLILNNSGDSFAYAQSIKLLLDLVGIESNIVNGEYDNGGVQEKHSWNIIKLYGQYYNLDTALDNFAYINSETNKEDRVIFKYFNISDDLLSSDHIWDKDKNEKCTNTSADMVSDLLAKMDQDPDAYFLKGDWIYYSDDSTSGDIYKYKVDGSSNIKLVEDDGPTKIIADDNYVYYSSDFIYRIGVDGGNKIKITEIPVEDKTFNVIDYYNGNLYYAEGENAGTGDDNNGSSIGSYNIYSYNSKTGGKTVLTKVSIQLSTYFKVMDDWIYYCTVGDNDQGLYRMKTDGSEVSKLYGDQPVRIRFDEGWIYFNIVKVSSELINGGSGVRTRTETFFYRMRLDGKGLQEAQPSLVQIS